MSVTLPVVVFNQPDARQCLPLPSGKKPERLASIDVEVSEAHIREMVYGKGRAQNEKAAAAWLHTKNCTLLRCE